jgi:2-polyprenyl-3-methyl-5-hydroxy-6-metoxy-1,4-benzoquinol methylase
MEKLICISRLDDFLVHHLPNKYVGTYFGVGDTEVRRQVDVLLELGENGTKSPSLFDAETRLQYGVYSKSYYEPIQPELVSAVPFNARSVLSIGCGWGATESWLVEKGLRVTAVPLDPVIPGGAQAGGVELVTGGFAEARGKLSGRQFDCLLLSNVLHLAPDPVEVLRSFSALLAPEGVSVAVVPNTARLGAERRLLGRKPQDGSRGTYEQTGTHLSSSNIFRSWFLAAGLRVEKFKELLSPRAQRHRYLTLGLMDSWIASEFIAVARRASCPSDGCQSW